MEPCPFEQKIHAFHDGELAPEVSEAVARHLAACEECRLELQVLEKTARALFPAASVRPPRDFSRRVMARIREGLDAENAARSFWDFIPVPRWELATAACAIALMFTYFTAHSVTETKAAQATPLLMAYAREASGSWILSKEEIDKEDVLNAAVAGGSWEEGDKEDLSNE